MPFIPDAAYDALLNYIQDNVTTLYICSQEPANYTEASSTYKLGTKTSPTVAEPSDRSPNGREIIVSAISDGSVDATGTASHWALCSGSVLYATNDLAATQGVTSGNTFSLTQFEVGVPDAVSE